MARYTENKAARLGVDFNDMSTPILAKTNIGILAPGGSAAFEIRWQRL
jgi:hypothetical protein